MRSIIASLLLFMASPGLSQAPYVTSPTAWRVGQHYEDVSPPNPAHARSGKLEVIEFFSYGSRACADLEPHLSRWIAAHHADIDFVRVPIAWGHGRAYARLFYILQVLNRPDLHDDAFESLIQHGGRLRAAAENLTYERQFEFVVSRGVSAENFKALYFSPMIDGYFKWGEDRARAYRLESLPTVVIGGRYITNADRAGSAPALIDLMSALVERVKNRMPSSVLAERQ